MVELPVLPTTVEGCGLERDALRLQGERYRQAGVGAKLVERTPRRLMIQLAEHTGEELVREIITVERACCPFLDLDWDRDQRWLTISLTRGQFEPVLATIAAALGM